MKKTLILTIVAITLSVAANAQISKGTFYVGGSLGFASDETKNKAAGTETTTFESSSFNFSPRAAYFVADKTAIGLRAGISNRETTFNFNNGDKTVTTRSPITVGLFGERYFMIIPQFGFTGGVFANFITGSAERETVDGATGVRVSTESDLSGFSTGLTGGTIWFPSPHIGISAQVGVVSFTSETETVKDANPEISTTETGFNFDLSSLNLNFGFHYYFFK
ncbi:MAG: outer membrane beta-barrel protein [bacterium]